MGVRFITYAARFWALRLLCAGTESFSSLLLLRGSARLASSPSNEMGSVCWLLASLDSECLVKDSGGECGGGTKDWEGSSRNEGSKPGKFWLKLFWIIVSSVVVAGTKNSLGERRLHLAGVAGSGWATHRVSRVAIWVRCNRSSPFY